MSVCMESNLYVKELQSSPTAYPNMTLESNIGHFQDGDRSRIGFEMGNKLSNETGDRDTGDHYFIDESLISNENDVDKKKNNQSNGISANHLQNGNCYHGDKIDVINQNEENSSENWSVISVNSDGDMIDRENLTSADSGCENEITEQSYDPDDEVNSDCFHSNNNTILRKSCQNDGKFIISRTPENLEVIDEEMELTSNTDVTGSNSTDCDICRTNIIQGSMSDDGNVDPYDLSDGERLKEDEEFVIQLNSYKSYNDLSRLGIEDCLCSDKPDVFTNNNQMNGANEGSCNSCSQDGRNSRFSSISENDLEEEIPTEGSTEETLHMCSENEIEESSVELDIYSHGQGCLCSECSAFTSLSSSQLDINQFKEYCEQAENEEDVFVSQSDLRSKVGRSRTFHGTDEHINHEQIKNLYVSADDQFIQYGAKEVSVQSSSFTTSEHGLIEHAKSQFTHSGQLSPQFSTRESGFYDGEVENHEILDDEIEEEVLAGNDNKSEDMVSQQDIEEEEEYENQEVLTEDDVTQTSCNVIHTSSNVRWDDDVMCTCEECLRGLRIERIVTEDKATMCPEEPPYVLMCEICEELLENQLQKTEKDSKKKEETLKREIKELKRDNDAHQKVIQEYNSITRNLQLGPEAKIEATMQHEITRLTSENLDLRESKDKKDDQIRKLKKMLKVYAKRLKDGEAAEIAAELEKEDKQASVDNMASVKHRERSYMGMLEYRKDDETVLIKNLIMDLKPKVASGLLPGLPAYVLFMCVRHTDYINDDEKVRSLLTNTINGIKKCVKKHNTELDRVTLWLANTCRLLHTLKQYSGEKAFQSENTSRQNEHCLRNFDLSEYRQVFSDLAVWIYQSMIKHMEETLQPMVVPAVLEHEAIAGLSASKPSGMRGRSSSSHSDDIKELSLDSLMKALNKYIQVLSQHAVDPELVKQIFRQIYHFICAGALNNLLLRKDMCNWSKGMQIRYNLSHLEQWLRDNKLQESGAQETLEPVIQASQLLQARKSVADVDSICEMCSKLTTPQIVKILNLYTPVDEFEEKVPVSFIRKIQEKLKSRQGESDNTLLMDTKYAFP